MTAIEALKSYAVQNKLKVWDNSLIPDLGSEIMLSLKNFPVTSFSYYGHDDLPTILNAYSHGTVLYANPNDILKQPWYIEDVIIIGEFNCYEFLFSIAGDVEVIVYNSFSDVIPKIDAKIPANPVPVSSTLWSDSQLFWNKIYSSIKVRELKISGKAQLSIELLNSSINDSNSPAFFVYGVPRLHLEFENSASKASFIIEARFSTFQGSIVLFLEISEGIPNHYTQTKFLFPFDSSVRIYFPYDLTSLEYLLDKVLPHYGNLRTIIWY